MRCSTVYEIDGAASGLALSDEDIGRPKEGMGEEPVVRLRCFAGMRHVPQSQQIGLDIIAGNLVPTGQQGRASAKDRTRSQSWVAVTTCGGSKDTVADN